MAATSYTATQIAHTPTGGVAATNVQAAVAEVAADVIAEAAARGMAISAEVEARTALDVRLTTEESRHLLFIQDAEPATDSTALWIEPGGGIYVQVQEA